MAFTQITTSNLDNTITTKLAAAEAANAAVANIVSLAISSVQIADSSYNVLDDTAANTGGGYLVINGTGFTNQCVVIVGTTNATSTTFANTKQLRAQVPGLAAATYPLYVVDSVTGATAIKVNGLTYSSFPAWSTGSTLSNQLANTSFAVSLSANSDSSITYSNTTALPAGTTLAANGYFSGTVSIGAQTTYSFDVKATDAELQDATRTFSLTVTITPVFQLYTWSNDGFTSPTPSSPVQVGSPQAWSEIASTLDPPSILAIKSDGTLWAWGKNESGQLGLNDLIDRSSPTQVGTNTNWSKIDCGIIGNGSNSNSCGYSIAIKTDGTLWAWGQNVGMGQLGFNDRVSRSSPVQVGTETNWASISASKCDYYAGFFGAIKTDGTMWLCGHNGYGQLGIGSTGGSRSSPTQVSGSTWAVIGTGNMRCHAIRTNGTLFGWGHAGYSGALGLDNNSRNSPMQVGSLTNWSFVVGGMGSTTAAIKNDGTLWMWGRNTGGVLGINQTLSNNIGGATNTNATESATQVGSETTWSSISISSSNAAFARKTDGTIWSWGSNDTGQLGHNNVIYRSSPTQIGTGTNWTKIVARYLGAFALTST